MREIGLLRQLVGLENDYRKLQIKIEVWTQQEEIQDFQKELLRVKAKIQVIKQALKSVEDKSESKKAQETILHQLEVYIIEVNKVDKNLKLSRSQNMNLENYLFSSLLNDLHHLIIDKVYGYRVPAYLVYTKSVADSVEIPVFSEFLEQEISILNQIENPDYLKLRQFYKDFRNKMIKQFIS